MPGGVGIVALATIVDDIARTIDLVDATGHEATGLAAQRRLRGLLRRERDANGQLLLPFMSAGEAAAGAISVWGLTPSWAIPGTDRGPTLALGYDSTSTDVFTPFGSLAERWNGTTWEIQSHAQPCGRDWHLPRRGVVSRAKGLHCRRVLR